MRVAHIAFQYGLNNTGGAAIAATRLHQVLLKHGVESHYICVHAREKGENVHELPRGWKRRFFILLTKLTRNFWKLTAYRRQICLNVVPLFGLEAELKKIQPDVVHVQWLNADVASFEQVAKLPYKMVFNLHDLFVINAIESHPRKDKRFEAGFDKSNSTRLERWLFNRKRRMVERLHPTFIGPSDWACNMCRNSVVGRECKAFVISNMVDPIFLQPRLALNPASGRHSRFIVLWGAYGGRSNPYKGFSDLALALKRLPDEMKSWMELHVFGESASDCEIEGVKTHFLGPVSNSADLIGIYQSADVFAFPSREETQGMTKIEALLCGLPVVAFNRTACAEGIEHGWTGWIAPDGDCQDFTEGLMHYFEEWKTGTLGIAHGVIAKRARDEFSADGLVRQIKAVYETCANVET